MGGILDIFNFASRCTLAVMRLYSCYNRYCQVREDFNDPSLGGLAKAARIGTQVLALTGEACTFVDEKAAKQFRLVSHPTAEVVKVVTESRKVIGKKRSRETYETDSESADNSELYGRIRKILAVTLFALADYVEGDVTSQCLLLASQEATSGQLQAVLSSLFNQRHGVARSTSARALRTSSSTDTDQSTHSLNVRSYYQRDPELDLSPEEVQEIFLISRARTILHLSKIPTFFARDPVFSKYICPITNKPIRHITFIKNNERLSRPVFYEKEALDEWFEKNDRKKPPRWPSKVDYVKPIRVNIVPYQNEIDNQLRLRLIQAKQLFDSDRIYRKAIESCVRNESRSPAKRFKSTTPRST